MEKAKTEGRIGSMIKNKEEAKGMLYAVISAVFYGTMPLFAKYAFSLGSNAFMVSLGRFSSGAFFVGLWHLFRRQPLRIRKEEMRQIFLLSLPFSITPCLLYGSYRFIDSGLATTLHFAYPIAVVLFSVLLFRTRIDRRSGIAIVLCLSGILFLYTPGNGSNLAGALLAIASALSFAVYILGVERSSLRQLPVLTYMFWLSSFCTVENFFLTLLSGNLQRGLPLRIWLPYAALGVIAMFIAAPLFQRGVMLCGAVKTSILSTMEPVTSLLIGVLVFHELINGRNLFGVLLILIAVCLLALPKRETKK